MIENPLSAPIPDYRMVTDQTRFHAIDDDHRDLRVFDRDTGERVHLVWELNLDRGYVVTYGGDPDPDNPFQRTLLKRHGRFVVYERIQTGPDPAKTARERLDAAQEEYRAAIEQDARVRGLPSDQRIELTVRVVPRQESSEERQVGALSSSELDDVRAFFDARSRTDGKFRLKSTASLSPFVTPVRPPTRN